MEVIVYAPKEEEDRRELEDRLAKLHGRFVLQYVEKLSCPPEQKRQLLKIIPGKAGGAAE